MRRPQLLTVATGVFTICLAVAAISLAIANDPDVPVAPPTLAKVVTVDPTVFSDIYPAVWFSPSTGEIVALTEKSETPPHPRFEIWIEPNDPEFAFLKNPGTKMTGFAMIGRGEDVFNNPPVTKNPKFREDVEWAVTDGDGVIGAVFSCVGVHGNCRIMITAFDKEKELIRFTWIAEK